MSTCRVELPSAPRVTMMQVVLPMGSMKIADDYNAKYRLWAERLRVAPAGAPTKVPRFKSRRFSSHVEMNRWKRKVLRALAKMAPSS